MNTVNYPSKCYSPNIKIPKNQSFTVGWYKIRQTETVLTERCVPLSRTRLLKLWVRENVPTFKIFFVESPKTIRRTYLMSSIGHLSTEYGLISYRDIGSTFVNLLIKCFNKKL